MHGRNLNTSRLLQISLLLWAWALVANAAELPFAEPRVTGSAFFLENDWLLHPVHLHQEDRNYTMGAAWQTSGSRVKDWWISSPFRWVDGLKGFRRLRIDDEEALGFSHTLDVGVSAFTPDELEKHEPIQDDRPYASLLFVDVQRRAVRKDAKVAVTTELSIGVYGLGIAPAFQRGLHRATQRAKPPDPVKRPIVPEGWGNQISDGGEPTLRYGARAQRELSCLENFDAQVSVQGNLGYYTNVGAGTALRLGHIASNWWQFDAKKIEVNTTPMAIPKFATLAEPSFDSSANNGATKTTAPCYLRLESSWEAYIWAGGNATLWGYNGLMQGQFRHSPVRVSSDELERLVFDYMLGATVGFRTSRSWHRFTLAFSHRSPEVEFPSIRPPEEHFATRRSQQWGGIYYSISRR